MRFAIIGFGEVGSRFARDLHAAGAAGITAYDIAPAALAGAAATGPVDIAGTAAQAAAAEVVFVAVTAGAAPAAAASLAGGLAHAPLVVDVNSVAPQTRCCAARVVEHAGGRFVEAAIMTSVPPHGLRAPMLLGGPHAEELMRRMAPFGMRLTAFGQEIGRASAVKMCRSVLAKGIEALVTEALLAARRHGVEGDVLASLDDPLPHEDWSRLARCMVGRTLLHGRRCAEEIREAATAVRQACIEPTLSRAVAERQDWAGELGRVLGEDVLAAAELGPLLDTLPTAEVVPGRPGIIPPCRDSAGSRGRAPS